MKNYNNILVDELITRTDVFLLPEYEEIVKQLIKNQPNIVSVAIIDKNNKIAHTTTDWDLESVLGEILEIWGQDNGKYLTIGGKSYRLFL